MSKVQMNVWVDERDREELKRLATAKGISLGDLVREAVFGARADQGAFEERLNDVERRLARIEELASGSL